MLPTSINDTYALDFVVLQAKYYIYTKKSNNDNNFDFYTFLPVLKTKIDFEYSVLTNLNQTNTKTKLNLIYNNL
jgi:hypothetical protein